MGIGIDKDRVYRTVDVFKHGKVVVWVENICLVVAAEGNAHEIGQ